MRRYLPILYVLLGIVLGYFLSQFGTTDSKLSEQNNISTSEKNISDPNSATSTVTEKKPDDQKVCPVCPCLYSDEILGPPKWDPNLKEKIETNHEGEALIRWIEVPGAKRYNVYVESENGTVVKTFKASRTLVYLKDLPLPEGKFEADYFLRLATVNGKDEEGKRSERKPLHVKPQANVVAPAIQEIKVED